MQTCQVFAQTVTYTNYKLAIYSQQYTISFCCKKNLHILLLFFLFMLSFLHKIVVHRPVFIPFSTKDRDIHVYVHSWLTNNDDRNQQNDQLLSPFLLHNTLIYQLAILFINTTFFYWQDFQVG